MSSIHSFKSLAFRVHLKPTPRTQSESNAIFRALQDFGPVHTFQISRHELAASRDIQEDGTPQKITATLVFASNTKNLDEVRSRKSSRRFTVSANANIPSAEVKDPYNVRGLKNRKPELEARRFECQISPLELEKDAASVFDDLQKNDYSDTFAVDRNSIFGEILARTDCPSGLIHGLLPKLKDEHRSQALGLGTTEDRRDSASGTVAELRREAQAAYASRDVRFVHLNLNRSEDKVRGRSTPVQSKDTSVDGDGMQRVKRYDEFAELRNFSLVKLYREATGSSNQKEAATTGFQPFSR